VYLDGKPDQAVLQFDNLARRVLPRLVDMGSVDDTGCCHASTPGYVPPEVRRTATACMHRGGSVCPRPAAFGHGERAGCRIPRSAVEEEGRSPVQIYDLHDNEPLPPPPVLHRRHLPAMPEALPGWQRRGHAQVGRLCSGGHLWGGARWHTAWAPSQSRLNDSFV
jgi:hypothetical protein